MRLYLIQIAQQNPFMTAKMHTMTSCLRRVRGWYVFGYWT